MDLLRMLGSLLMLPIKNKHIVIPVVARTQLRNATHYVNHYESMATFRAHMHTFMSDWWNTILTFGINVESIMHIHEHSKHYNTIYFWYNHHYSIGCSWTLALMELIKHNIPKHSKHNTSKWTLNSNHSLSHLHVCAQWGSLAKWAIIEWVYFWYYNYLTVL